MITSFVRANAALLSLLTCLVAINAGAAFFALSTITTASANLTSSPVAEAVLLVSVLIGSAVASQRLSAKLGATFITQLRAGFVKKLLYQAYMPGSAHKGRSLSAFINDIAEIGPLGLLAPMAAYNLLFATAAMTYLFVLSIPLAALVVIELIAMGALSKLLQRRIAPAFDHLRKVDDELFSNVQCLELARRELLTNQHRANHFHGRVMLPAISASERAIERAHSVVGYFEAWSSNIAYIVVIVTVLLNAELSPAAPSRLSAFLVGCLIMIAPVNALIGSVDQLSRGLAALRRLRSFSVESEPEEPAGGGAPVQDWKSITLEGVCYDYDESQSPALGPLDATIIRGEVLFLVGGNGSGKTTLLLLIAGLLAPKHGRIFLDEHQIGSIKWKFRALLSVVFCDFHVFEHILDDKGEPAVGEAVEQLIGALGLQDVVEVSGAKLSKTDVSAGQRKRLALLQLMLEDRDILILDEMAADLDPEFKRYFYEDLLGDLRASGKTVILATHDAEYFGCADRLFRLESGRLVWQGPPSQQKRSAQL